MLSSTYVPSNDRQALRNHYYQVKARTTWCVKMGQSAILQTPEYLSRATMRLPMYLRVRWYEHIDRRSDRSNLVEFEKWLCKRVETLFNPLEDFISEEWSNNQRSTKSKPGSKINPLTTTTEISPVTPRSNNDLSAREQTSNKLPNKELEKKPPSTAKACVICKSKHPVVYCPVFKSKHLQERRKLAWKQELCFNCLKTNHQAKNCPSTKRCLKERCGRPHHTKWALHESALSVDDKRALAILESTTVKEEGHYKTALLWKGEKDLPNNRTMAVSRLHCTEKKLKKNPELAEKYHNVINYYVAKGNAQKTCRPKSQQAWKSPCGV